jgi:hypothetical protein
MNAEPWRYKGGYNNTGVADPVRRVGAGGVSTNFPLIITGGRKRYDLFHYNFTEPGKYPKNPRPGEVDLKVSAKVPKLEIADKIKYKLPRNFCPDCNRTDRMHEKGAINVWTMYDGSIDFDLVPGDAVITFWCQECQMYDFYGSKIQLPNTSGMDIEGYDEWRKRQIRQCRMDKNIVEYLRVHRDNPSIIVSQEIRDRLK